MVNVIIQFQDAGDCALFILNGGIRRNPGPVFIGIYWRKAALAAREDVFQRGIKPIACPDHIGGFGRYKEGCPVLGSFPQDVNGCLNLVMAFDF